MCDIGQTTIRLLSLVKAPFTPVQDIFADITIDDSYNIPIHASALLEICVEYV